MRFSNGERKDERLRKLSAIESIKALLSVGYISDKMKAKSINHICDLYPPRTIDLFNLSAECCSKEKDTYEDPASLIMQVCQAMNWTFSHSSLKESGPRHSPVYTTLCTVKINQTEEFSATSDESSIKLGRRKSSELVLKKIVQKLQTGSFQ